MSYFKVYLLLTILDQSFIKLSEDFNLERPGEKFCCLHLIKISKSYGHNQNHKSDYSTTNSKL